ncbi:hypothetical protein [Clostridium perfringens]|nr:hypothetical protein [Clostridium perfringens]
MKIKNYLGACTLFLAAVLINVGPASIFGVGIEEMPESIKKLR